MVVWWLCLHRKILIRNIRQKLYSQFPPVHDFRKPWWGVAYVPCITNLRALYAWAIWWHVACMLSLAEHWQGRRALSNHVCAHSVISMWHVDSLQHLARACSEQFRSTSVLPINHVIQMPRCLSGFVNHDYWGWRHWQYIYLPQHELALVIEWQGHVCSFRLDTKPSWHLGKWKSGPTSKRDPWPKYRPTGKCPLYRFEATGQLLHSAVGSNQVVCRCTWKRYLPRDTNTGATKEIPALNQSWRGCNHPTSNWPYQATKSHILSRGPPTACHHCGQTLSIDHMLLEWAVLQNIATNTKQLTHWKLFLRQFPRLA